KTPGRPRGRSARSQAGNCMARDALALNVTGGFEQDARATRTVSTFGMVYASSVSVSDNLGGLSVLSCAAIEIVWGEPPRARKAGSRRTFTIFSPRLVPMNGGARLRRALILQGEVSGLDGSLAPPRGHA